MVSRFGYGFHEDTVTAIHGVTYPFAYEEPLGMYRSLWLSRRRHVLTWTPKVAWLTSASGILLGPRRRVMGSCYSGIATPSTGSTAYLQHAWFTRMIFPSTRLAFNEVDLQARWNIHPASVLTGSNMAQSRAVQWPQLTDSMCAIHNGIVTRTEAQSK